MKVVFLEEVPGSGYPGDVKDVANGFARNYLLPRKLATAASKQNLQKAAKLAETESRRQEKLDHEASGIAEKLDGQTLTFTARVGDQGRLFGSITAGDIAEEATKLAGEEVDRHKVHLGEPIKEIGQRPVKVRLTRNIEVEVVVDVRPHDESAAPIEPTIEEVAAAAEAEIEVAAEAEVQESPEIAAVAETEEPEAVAEAEQSEGEEEPVAEEADETASPDETTEEAEAEEES
jgi:large subunit ribosomal protein L9